MKITPPNPIVNKPRFFTISLVIISAIPLHASTYYWDTTVTGKWSTGANWSTNPKGTPAGTVSPSSSITSHTVVFNGSSINGDEIVQLDATTRIRGITFSNTGTTDIVSSPDTPRSLTIGSSGITVNSLAGAVTIGSVDMPVPVTLGEDQAWTNHSSNPLEVVNNLTGSEFTLTLDGVGDLAIRGTFSGKGGLTKAGSGTATLTGLNTHTGITTLAGGTLSVDTIGNGGVAGNLGQATKAASNLVFDGGTLRYTGAKASSDRGFTLGEGSGSIDASGSGTLTLSGGVEFIESGPHTLTLSGETTGIFSGILGDGSRSDETSLTKIGPGNWTLSGKNRYSGITRVSEGRLAVDGAIASDSPVIVESRGTLGGGGTIGGDVTVSGQMGPGNDRGILTVSATTSFSKGSIFEWELDPSKVDPEINRGVAYDGLNTAALSGSGAIFKILLTGNQDFTDSFWNETRVWSDIFKSVDGWSPLTSTNIASVFNGGFQFSYNGNTMAPAAEGRFMLAGSSLTWAAVPELCNALPCLLLIVAGLLRRHRGGIPTGCFAPQSL